MSCFNLIVFSLMVLFPQEIGAKKARTVLLDDKRTESIYIATGDSTILSFPAHPTKVILGNSGLFSVQYVENDLAISALRSGAKSNLFVYLEGRRFGFDLRTASGAGDELVIVRDSIEQKVQVKIKDGK